MKSGSFKTAMLWVMLSTTLFMGCSPMQPYYLHEDGDLSHYIDTANEIDFPDVDVCSLEEVTQTHDPLTIKNIDLENLQTEELTLEVAIATALNNSKVIRSFGNVRNFGQFVTGPAERLSAGPDSVGSVYDVAIQETGQGGVEQVLSNFDAVFNSTANWESFDRLQNFGAGLTQTSINQSDSVNWTNELSKQSASGAQYFLRNTNTYFGANDTVTAAPRIPGIPSDWFTTIEAEVRQPLLRNRGTQVNRIPVVLARIRTDVSLTVFESQVANLLSEVERAYWELYFFYHNLEAAKIGRDSALGIWRRVYAKYESGAPGGEAEQEAQSREQYYTFRSRVEGELNNLLKTEARLRYLLGWSPSDGRLIRPVDSATTAELNFDWNMAQREALMRAPSLRQQRWQIKRRELELIAARNQLLPRLDAVALYRWTGSGDEFNSDDTRVAPGFPSGAIQNLFDGDQQEHRIGFEAEIPLGFRREMSQVRSQQLLLAREKARMEDMELEVIHQLDDAFKDLDAQYQLLQTGMNRLAAAQKQVESVEAAFDAGTVVLDLLLDAQRRRADAEAAYYQALVEYNLAIVTMHFRKGSIMDYNSVVMAEGPWPAKAYFDAQNAARQRDASYCINYGYSRPDVISRGPVQNNVPQSAQPASYTSDPYPAESRYELPESDSDEDSDADDGDSDTDTGEPRLKGPDSDEIPDPPSLDEGYDYDVPETDGPPPLEEGQLEARQPRRTARTEATPQQGSRRRYNRGRQATTQSTPQSTVQSTRRRPQAQTTLRIRQPGPPRKLPAMPSDADSRQTWSPEAPTAAAVRQASAEQLEDSGRNIQLQFKE